MSFKQFLNEEHDVASVKKELPEVKVNFDGEEHIGYMRTGDTRYAYVHLKDLPGTKFQYDWDTIVDAVNNGTVLDA